MVQARGNISMNWYIMPGSVGTLIYRRVVDMGTGLHSLLLCSFQATNIFGLTMTGSGWYPGVQKPKECAPIPPPLPSGAQARRSCTEGNREVRVDCASLERSPYRYCTPPEPERWREAEWAQERWMFLVWNNNGIEHRPCRLLKPDDRK